MNFSASMLIVIFYNLFQKTWVMVNARKLMALQPISKLENSWLGTRHSVMKVGLCHCT
jgi:hypothetical protein